VIRSYRMNWQAALALALCCFVFAGPAKAQVAAKVDVRGYLCSEPDFAREFQRLAATNPKMPRAAALWRFNRTRSEPRCRWYDWTAMIYKGALRNSDSDSEKPGKQLFLGGAGGVFEVLVYQTPDGEAMLYSWRRTADNAG